MIMVCALAREQAVQIAEMLDLGQEGEDWVFASSPSGASYSVPDRIVAYEQPDVSKSSRYGLILAAAAQAARRSRIRIEWVQMP